MAKRSNAGRIAICRYQPKKGKEQAFARLLARHHAMLMREGLASREPHLVLHGKDDQKRTFYVEIMKWSNPHALAEAHEHAAVLAMWEPMGRLCDKMEFTDAEAVSGLARRSAPRARPKRSRSR